MVPWDEGGKWWSHGGREKIGRAGQFYDRSQLPPHPGHRHDHAIINRSTDLIGRRCQLV